MPVEESFMVVYFQMMGRPNWAQQRGCAPKGFTGTLEKETVTPRRSCAALVC
jgi:hypothetical protein